MKPPKFKIVGVTGWIIIFMVLFGLVYGQEAPPKYVQRFELHLIIRGDCLNEDDIIKSIKDALEFQYDCAGNKGKMKTLIRYIDLPPIP
jgi:hypothetical protein